MHPKFRKFIENNMTVDDMPNDTLKMIAEHIGIEATVKLLELMQGAWMSIPRNWNQKIAKRYVRENYSGDAKAMVYETGISRSKIYEILNERANPGLRQVGLDELINGSED
ncbi:MAG: hypothetical protein ACOX2F_07345 [bacterium]